MGASAKVMMKIATNSLVHQKKEAQGEEEARDRRKGGQTGTATLSAYDPTGPTRSRASDAKSIPTGENMDGGVGY